MIETFQSKSIMCFTYVGNMVGTVGKISASRWRELNDYCQYLVFIFQYLIVHDYWQLIA